MLLQVNGLVAGYGAKEVIHGVDIEVRKGEIVTLIGANGAGKTTLLMTICGSPRASGGKILFEGSDISQRPTFEIVRLGIAQAPEGRRIFPRMTVLENLQMGATVADPQYYEADCRRVFGLFPILDQRKAQRAGTLSGGEQQMLSIGRALMTNPDLMILDEATEGLAPLIVAEIWRVIQAIRADGIATLIVDRDYKMVLSQSERAVVLQKGQVVLSGRSSDLLGSDQLSQYLGV